MNQMIGNVRSLKCPAGRRDGCAGKVRSREVAPHKYGGHRLLITKSSKVLLLTHTVRMRSAVLVVLVVVAVVAVLTRAQELKYSEREVVTNLAAQILRVVHGPWGTSAAPSKRNSELINALLGSPTLMGEVGRK
ncbi:pigment-dispersing hormone 1 peptides-like isoform X1 [Procambarus clarkii]|uniref:pigment-dispersing hormone 1 peptides-like isoform X1 n=1 Tax=Procambarus clarkii TaxID=6728 RepID=UPI0037424E7E